MSTACYIDNELLLWDDNIAAWDEDKCYNLVYSEVTPSSIYSLKTSSNWFVISLISGITAVQHSSILNQTIVLNSLSNSEYLLNCIKSIHLTQDYNGYTIYNYRGTAVKPVASEYTGITNVHYLITALKSFITNITSESAVSLIRTNYIYNKILDIYGNFEVFINIKVKSSSILAMFEITDVGISATLPSDYVRVFLPLNKYRFKQDNLSSTLMNNEITNLYKIISDAWNGGISYGGVYKWVYNITENSLDLLYKNKVMMRVDYDGNLQISGTVSESVTF